MIFINMPLRCRARWLLCMLLCVLSVGGAGCATSRLKQIAAVDRPATTGSLVERPPSIPAPERLPPTDLPPAPTVLATNFGTRLVSHDAPADNTEPLELPPPEGAAPAIAGYPINLSTALRLADASNLQIAYAREQVEQSYARHERSRALWLPSLRGGVSYNRHQGAIQDVAGTQFITSRGAFYTGAGAGAYGQASPGIPGAVMSFHLADALFQPLAARQQAAARERAAVAASNDTLWQVSLAYMELLRACQDAVIAAEAAQKTGVLAQLTGEYARTGEGLQADADRAQAELTLKQNDVQRTREAVAVASARLAQLLRLDPTVSLAPLEPSVAPIELVPSTCSVSQLIGTAFSNRPELSENQFLIGEASQRLRREKYAPCVPNVLIGTSYGGLSSGIGADGKPLQGRLDLDAIAYWELRNLGLGDQAARREAGSLLRQTQLRNLQVRDLVAREVVEAHAQADARVRQIETARQGIAAALQSYERNLTRIRGGQGLPLEVLQSIQALAQARRDYLRAVVDYDIAEFSLYRAVGWPGQSLACHLSEAGLNDR